VKQIIIDSEAENELSDSVAFYERRESGLGLEFERAARQAVQTIQADPERHPFRKDGTRRFVWSGFPSPFIMSISPTQSGFLHSHTRAENPVIGDDASKSK
jgi:hypothetical protein